MQETRVNQGRWYVEAVNCDLGDVVGEPVGEPFVDEVELAAFKAELQESIERVFQEERATWVQRMFREPTADEVKELKRHLGSLGVALGRYRSDAAA